MTPERRLTRAERRARNKELARQRQARYRARQQALDGDAVSFSDVGIELDSSLKSVTSQPGVTQNGDVTRVPTGDASNAVFRWKNPLKKDKAPAKLFSKKEAEDRQERMAEIFMRMTGLMDQVLEIIVRGHEEVTIWQMSDDEATMFAESLLTQAQASHESAATARKLLDMYERLYMYAWVGPRLVATGRHIKKQGGFGWR